jgi:protein-L-isoaspartate(D-aspartate) O-methyltransferase
MCEGTVRTKVNTKAGIIRLSGYGGGYWRVWELRKDEGFTMKIDARRARNHMVEVQIAGRGIRDRGVLGAMRTVPREIFDEGFEEFAYEDNPLPISERQTISQPYIVALMTEAAEIDENDRLLEVGAGSGYAAAVAAQIAKQVCAIERH